MKDRARRRVVVTGVGAVTAFGWSARDLWEGVCSGRTAIADFDRFDHTAYRTHVAAQVPDAPGPVVDAHPDWKRYALADRFAVSASREALAAAGLDVSRDGRRQEPIGVFFGSSTGGMLESETWFARAFGHERGRPDTRLLSSQQVGAPGEVVARRFGFSGPVWTASSACASGSLAIEAALDALRSGEVRVAVAGGSDSLCRITYGGFNALRSVSETPSTPFRESRTGLSIGEGAGVLVLEALDSARERGAVPLAALAGAGSAGDAHHMTAPHPEGVGAARALEAALADADVDPGRVDLVNAHGTGTPLNDVAEWRALSTVLGSRARSVAVTSTKAAIGHLLGSAGSVEAVVTALSVKHGVAPPTPGEGPIDPEAPVDLVVGAPRAIDPMRSAVSLNLAFGGCNAAVVFTSLDDTAGAWR